ncbi:MAG: type II toxin-antitoxin system VapC family toxin [Chromatiaceae bacterium]|nr:type II toxin-antitoxin system VapC family toxin [Gammaproteobacteria bacterium]MCP5317717.1 type II toxin-antitoxin system VapC family toxin [Chromatiaceae bacterium]MCP5429267.1 type II toxin-antitoxin system VapC family toxin [Chromatiaceae bacterium]MCP5434811.1 type II toxin-antitoxin system VapC family toxin [Chromatiaceae bacterium]HOP15877.1 type II toxin-antitoxin system VapC family toxin [Gammaproteobacteria bacterium]
MRRLLIDTHVFLWWLADDPQLGPKARELIANAGNQVFVSAATAWEISIKKSIGKLDAPDDLDAIAEEEGFEKLPISFFHGEHAGELPQHHRDPFDRMLVAQSQAEGLEIITADSAIANYAVKTISALT